MATIDQLRLERQQKKSRSVNLWRSLQSLRTIVSFMNTGAHPDDETSSMLAAMGLRDGISLSYACANRGEGGQNDIGLETIKDLGVLRTAEMEEAANILNMRLYWLSESAEDSIFDFGFSKSGVETLKKWHYERTLKRFVDIVRTEKPDIVCPTFLDIPGQHGHHRAMTQLAHEVFLIAADENYAGSALTPWQIKKLYLPAWSGAGDAYDDDLPPPPASMTFDANGEEFISGWTWKEIGQHSRAFHRTQGMGRHVSMHADASWPLHLAASCVASDAPTLTSGLIVTLADYATRLRQTSPEPKQQTETETESLCTALETAQHHCNSAIQFWFEDDKVIDHATTALGFIREAQSLVEASTPDVQYDLKHKLLEKESQLSQVIFHATGSDVFVKSSNQYIHPGCDLTLQAEFKSTDSKLEVVLAEGWTSSSGSLESTISPCEFIVQPRKSQSCQSAIPSEVDSTSPDATDCYPDFFDPAKPVLPAVKLTIERRGTISTTWHPMECPPIVIPQFSASVTPARMIVNVSGTQHPKSNASFTADIDIGHVHPQNERVELELPDTWTTSEQKNGFKLTVPTESITVTDQDTSLIEIPVIVGNQAAYSVNQIQYPHVPARARIFPASIRVRLLDAALPDVQIGYVGGGNDRVAYWLRSMGLPVQEVTDQQLARGELAQFDTLIVGIFAMRTRPALLTAMPTIHEWVHSGGNLLTLYHRPWDHWNPDTVPPLSLTIGKPSLRWRVTDENAEVSHLVPDHVLLNYPNKIGIADWANWRKERGLYFASDWHKDYDALLGMQDPDEKPHHGALLSARFGKGRHTHTSLILHHQMEQLVPGAFRLMANLVAGANHEAGE